MTYILFSNVTTFSFVFSIRVHLVLAKLKIVHFLCFGSLWGQVRIGRALPWARKIEMCLIDTLRDDILITKTFREDGLSATYLYASGVYRIQENDNAPKLEIIVFEEDSVVRNIFNSHSLSLRIQSVDYSSSRGEFSILYYFQTQMMRRVGWTRRVLPPDCELSPSLQCFPPQLVISPLPAKQFGKHLINVPREGIELQKYHYPNDWWIEIKPTDCIEANQESI